MPITGYAVQDDMIFRIPEQCELYLSGLRLAMGEAL